MPAINIAGNIEAELDDLLRKGKKTEANAKALQFIESIELTSSCLDLFPDADDENVLRLYTNFLNAVDALLFERKTTLLPRQANIFTTNYDSFIETAARESKSIILNDGFDRASSLDSDYLFAPELFFDRTFRSGSIYSNLAEVPALNLLKIHGSVTWQPTTTGIRFLGRPPKALTADERTEASKVQAALDSRAIVLPNVDKFKSTLMDRTYYDLLRMYTNALDRENSLLVAFGFSFADEHILEITRRGLRNPTAELVVFAYDEASQTRFKELFEHHRNVMIVAPPEAETLDFERFNALLEGVVPLGTDVT